jgi:hypothetical protein
VPSAGKSAPSKPHDQLPAAKEAAKNVSPAASKESPSQ